MNNLIGQHLGPYRITEQIGVGGMATVYKAYQPAMDRYVAVKVIASHFAQDETFLKRFRREARAVAQLEHAHILPVHDYGEAEGRPYLVMRYLEAGTLKDRIVQGPLPLGEVSRIIGQIGTALDYAHRMGVVHRDVKPTNVLLDAEGDAFLTDFGLAKMVEASAQLTGTGVGVGTPAYMSPEQGKGAKVDSRADVYSLGVVLYEMVTGHAPYEAETPLAVVIKHITEPLPLPRSVVPDLPEEVERVILRAMAKEPDDRFQTAGEMVQALDAAVRASEAAARTEPATPAVRMEPAVAEVAVEPAKEIPGRTVAGVRQALPAGWGRIAAWVAIGIVALLVLFLALSRVPLRVQISGGQLEVVRVVEGTPTEAVPTEETPTLTPLPTVSAVLPPAPGSPAGRARAFAEPILAAIADRAPDYEDDFGDPASGWPTGSTTDGDEWGYEDDAYFISATYQPQGECCISVAPDSAPSFSDLVLELDAQFISGGPGLWGLTFRNWSGTAELVDHYAVGFWPDGHWRMWKNIGGIHSELLATDASPVAFGKEYETNHLTIIARGPRIAFYVNGEPLWFIHDESVSRGGIDLMVENTDADSLLRVHFDNFKVWDISDLELPSTEPPAPMGRIVYMDDKTGNEEIYVANSDGLSERRLTDHPAGDWDPTWSPDGTRIVFTSDRDATHEEGYQLYVMDADGSNLIKLTTRTDRNAKSASWSPDGSRIAFHSYCDLTLINADGSNWTTLVEGRENLCPDFPTWAPDGHRIAFRNMTLPDSGPPVQHDIYVVNDDGSGLVKLTTLTSEDWSRHVVWSPDGSQVAFDILADGQERYYAVNSDGSGEPVEIPSIPDSWYPWYWPWWDGEAAAAQPPTPGSPVDQARAFAEPILSAIADRAPDYADDFSDPGSGWPIGPDPDGGERGYKDGTYHILAQYDHGIGVWPDHELWFSDLVLEVDAQFVSGEWGNWGVIFRDRAGTIEQPGNAQYSVGFYPDGTFDVGKNVRGVHMDLLGHSAHAPTFEQGFKTNHLTIIAQGPQIAFYVNGEPLWFVYDESSSRGRMELNAASLIDDTTLQVQFDNLRIWDISDLPLPSAEAMPRPSLGEQARAFVEPILSAIADLPPDYEDDFSNPASGWDRGTIVDPTGWEEGERGYADGEYYIIAPPARLRPQMPEQPMTCASGSPTDLGPLSDMVLEVEGRFVKAENGNRHINFRQWYDPGTDVGGKYEVMFEPSGNVWIGRVHPVEGHQVLAQTQGLSAQAGFETTRLQIVTVGPQIAVYVNGEPALFFADPDFDERYESGTLSVVACNGADTPMEVRWDNLRIWDISDLELPSAEATPAPSPGGQVRAFAEPILTALGDRAPDYADTYTNPDSGWSVGQNAGWSARYENEAYILEALPGVLRASGHWLTLPPLQEFVLEAEMQQLSGRQGDWAILLRYTEVQENGNGLCAITFGPDDQVGMVCCLDDYCPLGADVPPQFVNPFDQVNRVTIIARGPQIAVAVNDHWSMLETDPFYNVRSPQVRLALGLSNLAETGDTPFRVRWDNLKIWDISDQE